MELQSELINDDNSRTRYHDDRELHELEDKLSLYKKEVENWK